MAITDISDLLQKQNNASQQAATESIPPEEKLTAEEFKRLVQAVQENQKSVRSVKMGSNTYTPDPDGAVTLPYTAEGTEVLLKTSDSTTSIVSITGSVKLHLLFTSTTGGYDTGNSGTLFIQTYSNGQWTTQGSMPIASKSATASYDEIDITPYLATGSNRVRVYVNDDSFGSQSNYIIFDSVVLTSLRIEMASDYQLPITENYIQPAYYIYGAGVSKTLHIRISGEGGNGYRDIEISIGTNTYTTSTYVPSAITDTSTQPVKVITHGVHTIESWLTCVDGDGKEMESEHIINSLMVVTDSSDMTPYLLVQNLKKDVTNYEQTNLFDYAIYNPSGEDMDIAVVISDFSGANEYLRIENRVANQTQQHVLTTIEIENDTDDTVYGYLKIYRKQNGQEINFLQESVGTETEIINVDNKEKFSPTSGADFFLNPKIRNNTETNPARILNAAKDNVELPGAVFTNFGFVNDGWMSDEDGQRVLRVLAGQYLTIPYEPFEAFKTNTASSMTLELDFKVRNITNETDPILQICSTVAATGKPLGIYMRPLDGFLFTRSSSTEADQNFAWEEGERVHIAINIVHALRSSTTSTTTVALVRVFINGVINREFPFEIGNANEFITNAGHGGIRIGQIDADIDIYSIRCYKKVLSADECMQDYRSTLPTSAQKIAFRDANDILEDGVISYNKAKEKYNVLVWHGYEPNHTSQDDQFGWLEISMLKADGTPDLDHSGTIGKKYGRIPCKGQGTTAKTYYYWNQQWTINKAVDTNGNKITDDGWIDGNGNDKGMKYQLTDDIPAGQKMVLKINYASSMQSHKQGATELYSLLHTKIVGQNSMQKKTPTARVAVLERPFLYFIQTPEDNEPVFHGLGTFGPGKMDKKTWGYDEEAFPDFAMIEGADNNKPLTDMRVPWDEKVSYSVKNEAFIYNEENNLNFDAGLVYEEDDDEGHVKDQPLDNIVEYFQDAWNWLFMHNTSIIPYTAGNFNMFIDDTSVDTKMQYWMTQNGGGASMFDVYRYDFTTKSWVQAGLNVGGIYQQKNLQVLYPSATNGIPVGAWDELNKAFIAAIVADARAHIGEYFNARSILFHYAFVNHLLAGTDNCSKNTYYSLDPVTHLVEMHQDDLDTIFKTDNSAYQIKPYYIDRMHPYSESGELLYTEGGSNVLFNLIELMYENGNPELASMMNEILTAMADLIDANDQKNGIEKSAWGAFQKYFFSIQQYFPAVAYNETARIRYEYPTSLNFVSDRSVKPITQSLGDQLASEKQYVRRRLVYVSSYAAYGEFSLNGDNGFGFNTYPRINGSSPTVILDVVPHQYLYPTARVGQTLRDPHVRVAPKETYHFVIDNTGNLGDTVCGLKGGNYYRSFGNLGDLSLKPDNDFTINGERLVEIISNPTGDPELRPSRLNINTPLITKIDLKGSSLLGGQLNLANCIRLTSIDIRDTRVTSVRFPTAKLLTSVKLGGYLTALEIENLPSLVELTLDAYTYLTSFVIGDNVGTLDLYQTIAELYDAKHNEKDDTRKLTTLEVRDVNWTGVTADFLSWLISIDNLKITGSISMLNTEYMTFELKKALVEKFGNIDSDSNPLRVSYVQRTISSIQIGGDNTFREPGTRKFTVIPNSQNANNFVSITWSLASSSYATVDPRTGVVTVNKISETAFSVLLKCVVVTTERTLEVTKNLYLYDRPANLGDYVYSDGSYSDMIDPLKSIIGICFYLGSEERADGVPDRRMVALQDITCYNGATTCHWGLYSGDNNNGITGITFEGISNVYDIPLITNFTSSGMSTNYITDANYRDLETGDKYGFKIFTNENTAAGDIQLKEIAAAQLAVAGEGVKEGEKVPAGLHHTLAIISHRNSVLDAAGLSIPSAQFVSGKKTVSEIENLRQLIGQIISQNGDAVKFQQYYWPAASYCYAYEPNVAEGEELAPQFRAHNWYLPSSGELARQYWYYLQGLASDLNIFATAINGAIMANFTSSGRWSSSEYNQTSAWYVYFSNGGFGTINKSYSYAVRAVCAF